MDITHYLKQTATYKTPGTPDGYGGVTGQATSTIDCRWVSKFSLIKNEAGEEVVSRAVVITENKLAIGGHLDLTGGEADQEGYIMAIGSTPSVDGAVFLNKCWLE